MLSPGSTAADRRDEIRVVGQHCVLAFFSRIARANIYSGSSFSVEILARFARHIRIPE
jgi:hypothetical protein